MKINRAMGDHHKHAAWCGSRRKIQFCDARNFPRNSALSPMHSHAQRESTMPLVAPTRIAIREGERNAAN
jgi:hypothetical protein